MKCYKCGRGELVREKRHVPYFYKRLNTILAGIEAEWCPLCGEVFFSPGENDPDKKKEPVAQEVNVRMGEAEFVARVRKKLGLGQREADIIFGGGINAFSRYEKGKASPPAAIMHLLHLLDEQPELLEKMKFIDPVKAAKTGKPDQD